MAEFVNDELGYTNWVSEHPMGYVLVSHNPPNFNYLTTHRADCHCINPAKAPHKKNWTKNYIKACGDSLAELQQWASTRFGNWDLVLSPCKHCVNSGRL